MGDVVVTRADREAALRALGCDDYSVPQFCAWLDTGESRWRVHFGVELVEAASVAATIARVRSAAEQRTREECAREVEAMAASAVSAANDLREDPMTSAMEACADQLDETVEKLRTLAERMRKGGGRERTATHA